MRLANFALALMLVATLAACTAAPSSTAPVVSSPTPNYPTLAVPTASADSGVITGRILMRLNNQPMPGITLYLGDRVPLEPGPGYTITHTQDGSPHTQADADGNFALADVPGDYALIIWTPINSKVIIDPNDATMELVVTIKANETTDLGDVIVDWP